MDDTTSQSDIDSQRPEEKTPFLRADTIRHLYRYRKIPLATGPERLLKTFSPSERLLLYVLGIVLAVSVATLLIGINTSTSVEVPSRGGTLSEGIVGVPRFVNPLLAISDADRDLTALVYSGLMRAAPNGSYIPDLAEDMSISDDGLSYTFMIRKDAEFHDSEPVTADDVIFTTTLAQTPGIKSPKRADWEGVVVEKIDERTVRFTLPRPYAPFIENTTIGILPKHLWESVPADEFPFDHMNTNPIGSGPFEVLSMSTDKSGAAVSYTLASFNKFALGRPYLNKIKFFFYPSEGALAEALSSHVIDSAHGLSPTSLEHAIGSNKAIVRTTLPRIFGLFLNQNRADIFAEQSVRKALDAAIDKERIIEETIGGFGVPLEGPIPPGILSGQNSQQDSSARSHPEEAAALLEKAGWLINEDTGIRENDDVPLSFTIKTSDTPALVSAAELVKNDLSVVGIKVSVEIFTINDLNVNVIRPREYEALLFGEIVGRTLDLFAFWHSSQREDPGLNLALYTNSKTDALLSKARVETDTKERERIYKEFEGIVKDEVPAIFLYAPDFVYVVPRNIKGITLGALTTPSERFLNVYEWYTETDREWEIFTR